MNTAHHITRTMALALLFILLLISFALAWTVETVTLRSSIDDYYAAAATIDFDAGITGDAILAGSELIIGHLIGEGLTTDGGEIKIRGTIENDRRTVGSDLDIEAMVGDDLITNGS